MFLVGDIFMRKFYTIFDRDNNKVGLARAILLKESNSFATGNTTDSVQHS